MAVSFKPLLNHYSKIKGRHKHTKSGLDQNGSLHLF